MAKLLGLHSLDGVFAAIKAAIAAKSEINDVSATITTDSSGVAKAEAIWNDGNLAFVFTNIKGDPLTFDELTTEQKAEIKGPKGDSILAAPEGQTLVVPVANSLGTDDQKLITQNAVVEALSDNTKTLYHTAVTTGYVINSKGKANASSSTSSRGVTDFIKLDKGQTEVQIVSGAWQQSTTGHVIYFYADAEESSDANNGGISGVKGVSSGSTSNLTAVVPYDAKYYRITTESTTDPVKVIHKGTNDKKLSYEELRFDINSHSSDGNISNTGVVNSGSDYFHTTGFQVYAGDLIVYHGYVNQQMSAIAEVITGESRLKPLVIGISGGNSTVKDFYFWVEKNMKIAISGRASHINDSWIKRLYNFSGYIKEWIDKVDQKQSEKTDKVLTYSEENFTLTREHGGIHRNGYITESQYSSARFQVYAGDVVVFHGYANYLMSAITKVEGEEGEEVYTPLVIGKSGTVAYDYFLKADSNMELVFSFYAGSSPDYVKQNESWVKRLYNFSGNSYILAQYLTKDISLDITPVSLSKNANSITRYGAVSSDDTSFSTVAIDVSAGDVVIYHGYASPTMAAISSVVTEDVDDEGGTSGTEELGTTQLTSVKPLVMGETNSTYSKDYVLCVEDGVDQIVVSGYNSKIGLSWLKIISSFNGNVKYLMESIANEKSTEVASAKINPIFGFTNIVAVGDSLTYCGVGNRQAYRPWPTHIQKKYGLDECLIFGRPGQTAVGIWNTFKGENQYTGSIRVPEGGKTIAFVYVGTNGGVVDEWLDTSAPIADVETYETSWANDYTGCYCKIVQRLLNAGAKVVLVLPRAGGTGQRDREQEVEMDRYAPEGWTLEDTRRSVVAIAERYNLAYVDARNCHSKDNVLHYFPDGSYNSLHYNDFGYAYFADKLVEELCSLPYEMMMKILPNKGQ